MSGMRMWRTVILAVACVQVLLFAVGLSLYPRLGDFGFGLAQDGRLTVNPNGPAYQAGLRSGDVPDASVAVAALQTPLGLVHQRLQVTIYRNGRPVRASIIARPATYPWSPSVALRNFIGLVLLVLGAFIVIRGDVTARTMWKGTFLVLTGWVALLQYLAAPGIAGIAGLQAGNSFYALSLFAAVAILFTFDVAADARLRVCSLACALACAAVVVAEILTILPSTVEPAWRAGLHASWLAPMLVATCYIVAVLRARGEQRRRLRVFATAVVPFCVVIGLGGALKAFGVSDDYSVTYIARIFELTLPFGMAYALFVRRVIDIGFAINRAVVFGLVSAVLVAIFVLIEWAGAEWLNRQSHTTNLAVGAVVALVLGLSMRFIHGKIDKFVDTVFFRKRHEDEQSLRRFAHEAAFITDANTLVERALEAVCMHGDASTAEVLLLDGGRYSGVSENDRAIVALKAWHRPLDLHTVATELPGEYAFALGSRGAVSGVLVVGRKKSGESYAPDELEAISALANATGVALASLYREPEQSGILAAIEASHADLARRLDTLSNGAIRVEPA